MKVIVFDLDDTLYEEISFVYSGFHAVATFLEPLTGSTEKTFTELQTLESKSRQAVFDRFLKEKNIFTKKLLQNCVSIYRHHHPKITLYKEALHCLNHLKNEYPLYLVTDGNRLVQRNKIQALQLDKWMKGTLCTSEYGLIHAKPSPYCFTKICTLEKVKPQDVVYVADNPHKDFIGLKPLGFQTVRVQTGKYKDVQPDRVHEAAYTIENLNESFLQWLNK
ncbi:MAG: hypothetical protein JWO53_972 [Chlamydiia bacterium]|nr:hypothetical protein [Chlamydiia bacterium]